MVKKTPQRVRLDLNCPEFLEVFLMLDSAELTQVAGSLRKLDWSNVYASKGLRWEAIEIPARWLVLTTRREGLKVAVASARRLEMIQSW